MSQIQVSNLYFAYDGSYDNVFENVSFTLDTDWRLGFTGRNGRGKTTFLQLLLGKYEYKGRIIASVDFEYFPYEVGDMSFITRDIVYEISPDAMEWEVLRELSLMEVSFDVLERPFNTLSNGERTKVLLAALFLKENSFLLIDEPTNHLDQKGRKIVADYLNSKNGFILVSHDRSFLDNCVDHVLSINRAGIDVQQGNFSSWYYNKKLQDEFELEKNTMLKKDISRLSRTAREKLEWSDRVEATKIGTHQADRGHIGHLAAKMMKRSKAIEKRKLREIEEKESLLKNIEASASLKINQLKYHTEKMVELKNISVFYDHKTACKDLSFTINSGDRIALCGANGSGKSSVIKLICGENLSFTGGLSVGSGLKISYVSQDTSLLSGYLDQYADKIGIDESLFKAILRKLDFQRVQFEKDIVDFSAGQKKKVLIAKSLCESAHLHIWDEPLNFIDVISRMQVEELLLLFKPTILFVEHDLTFSQNIANKIVTL